MFVFSTEKFCNYKKKNTERNSRFHYIFGTSCVPRDRWSFEILHLPTAKLDTTLITFQCSVFERLLLFCHQPASLFYVNTWLFVLAGVVVCDCGVLMMAHAALCIGRNTTANASQKQHTIHQFCISASANRVKLKYNRSYIYPTRGKRKTISSRVFSTALTIFKLVLMMMMIFIV